MKFVLFAQIPTMIYLENPIKAIAPFTNNFLSDPIKPKTVQQFLTLSVLHLTYQASETFERILLPQKTGSNMFTLF